MTVVVKVGGAEAIDPEATVQDVAALVGAGEAVVVVHGGSTAVDESLEALGIEPEYVTTPDGVAGRFTDAETMHAVSMALAGGVNVDLTVALQRAGVDAVGLAGVDGGLVTGPRKSAVRVLEGSKRKIKRGDHAGRIEGVNTHLIHTLLDAGYTPVISLPMLADDGVAVNTDADRLAGAVAGTLGATLVLLTDVAGVYVDPADASTRIDDASSPADLTAVESAATGFMSRKVMAAVEALEYGSPAVFIGDATVDRPVETALDGDATRIRRSALVEAVEG